MQRSDEPSNGYGQYNYYQQPSPINHQQRTYQTDSLTSSQTFVDPRFNPPSNQSSVGYKASLQDANSLQPNDQEYPLQTRYGAGIPSPYYTSTKSPYVPARYAQDGAARSPSPTPSEIADAKRGVVDFKKLLSWRTYAHKKYIPWAIVAILILVLVALMTIYHKEIVKWLTPVANWMHDFKFGWVIPIVVLFVISFPPLFGHEIVAVLCGLVWGLWIGFGIVAAGTLLGEIGNFYAFKWCLQSRGEKLEKQKLSYACLARVVREGGFKIALIARLSAVPGHFTTAVFSTCGMGIFVFTMAAILSMPKQFITVYLGVILEHSDDTPEERAKDKTSKLISNIVLVITFLITIAACWYIWREMNKVKPIVLKERRLAKKKLIAGSSETQALSRESNVELVSNDDHSMLVKPNDGGWGRGGGYGYDGLGNRTEESFNTPSPQRAKGSVDQWEMSENKNRSHAYPPGRDDPYQQSANANHKGRSSYEEASVYHHSKIGTQPPQISDVANLTGPRRTGRGWETSEGASTVGMGSWGGLIQESSESEPSGQPGQTSYPQSYPPTSHLLHPSMMSPTGPQQQSQRPHHSGIGVNDLAELGVLNGHTGLSAFGAPMGGGDTVMVTPRSGPGERQSVEMKGQGHALNRSMRAMVEDSDLSHTYHMHNDDYNQPPQQNLDPYASNASEAPHIPPGAAAPVQPGSYSYHTTREQQPSQDTFGQPVSAHSRGFASTRSSNDHDDMLVPTPRAL